jgi:hypothetical protein
MRKITSLFTRKNEFDSSLKFRLVAFIQPNIQNGEFVESRIRAYENLQAVLLENRRSNVKAEGLKSLFYARYFTFSV